MFEKYEDYETTAVLACAVAFTVGERFLRGRAVDRRRQLPFDLLAFGVVVVAAGVAREGLMALGQRAHLAELLAPLRWLRELPSVPKVAIAMLIADLWIYWTHRSMHRFGVLWRTHAWHHSVEELYWFSGFRTSVLHAVLYAIPQVIVPFFLFKLTVPELAAGFSIGVFFQFFIHSSADVRLGPLEAVIITPRYHHVHHSRDERLQSKNLGVSLTLWDRLFGTYVDPDTVTVEKMGIEERPPTARMIVGV